MHRALTFFNRDELLLNHQLIDAKTEKAEKHQIFWNVPWKDQTLRGHQQQNLLLYKRASTKWRT